MGKRQATGRSGSGFVTLPESFEFGLKAKDLMISAILDFGTNTFNLLIAERKERGFNILLSRKQPVKLGRGGIQVNQLTPDAIERGFVAITIRLPGPKAPVMTAFVTAPTLFVLPTLR